MSTIASCSNCGRTEAVDSEHAARAAGWTELSIDGVIGPANASEWTGRCPDCSGAGAE